MIAAAVKAPVTIETITVPDPGPGEALVRVLACGACHTDLHYREGGINDDFPFLLGHEAAGTVGGVGDGVGNGSSALCCDRSEPLGRYWRRRPLVFSSRGAATGCEGRRRHLDAGVDGEVEVASHLLALIPGDRRISSAGRSAIPPSSRR